MLALVLPLSAASGLAWQNFREMLANHYTQFTVLSLADANNDDLSFSSDTGMAECLVIARKLKLTEKPVLQAGFVSLNNRAQGLLTLPPLQKESWKLAVHEELKTGPMGSEFADR